MAYRPIVIYGDPILQTKAEAVLRIEPELIRLVSDMQDTMYSHQGVGLAAPQIGVSLQVIVLDTGGGKDPNQRLVLFNPELIGSKDEEIAEEGCLSLPEFVTPVRRATCIKVKGQTPDGRQIEIEARGLAARALQHEIDHINGRLIIDSLNALERDIFERNWRQRLSQGRKFF